MEIERKFLVTSFPDCFSNAENALVTQMYLTEFGSPIERRIRRIVRNDGGICFLTEKSGKGLSRVENERQISHEEFDELSHEATSDAIVKKRHFIPLGDSHTAELDIYDGKLSGLVTVEVEFVSLEEATAFVPPDWFGTEVTDDPHYKNRSLVENGLP